MGIKSKNKYVNWLWISLISQLVFVTISFILQNYIDENYKWMLLIIIPGIIYNTWLDIKADKEDQRLKDEN